MKQIVQSARSGALGVREVPVPEPGPGELLIRTRTSLISAGTERMVVEFAKKSLAGKARARPDLVRKVLDKTRTDGIQATVKSVLARLDEPLALGYSACGTVVRVGAGLEGAFRVGERVAAAGAGIANHAEFNAVPGNLAAPVPADVTDEAAAFATVGAIALHAVRNLETRLGELVAVIGAGLVGQLAVQLLHLSGARVVALDYDRERLALAERLGAERGIDLGREDAGAVVHQALSRGLGCDGVLIAAASETNEPFETAAAIARDRARICLVGLSGTTFPYAEFMRKELSVIVSRSYGPGRYDADYEERGVKYPPGFVRWTETENLGECLRLMAQGGARRLDAEALITHRFAIEEAEAAYALVTGGAEPQLGVIITYPETEPAAKASAPPTVRAPTDACTVGVIGAGNFARAVLLPELAELKGVALHTLVTRRGMTAEDSGRNFGFAHAETDITAVLDNADINAVLIATRHDSHAELATLALAAGKSVLVEKPLGLSTDEIDRVEAARADARGFLQVGFNRRFAPLVQKALAHLEGIDGPRFMVFRVNAGPIPADSWINHPEEGGGRILGEVCHFVDLARHLAGAPIRSVQADAAISASDMAEDVSVLLGFTNGSLATIAYTALGDSGIPKERFEVFAGGTALALDNFRSLTLSTGGHAKTHRTRGQDKGIAGSLRAFTKAVASGGPAPIDEAQLFETSRATLAVLQSLQTGARVDF